MLKLESAVSAGDLNEIIIFINDTSVELDDIIYHKRKIDSIDTAMVEIEYILRNITTTDPVYENGINSLNILAAGTSEFVANLAKKARESIEGHHTIEAAVEFVRKTIIKRAKDKVDTSVPAPDDDFQPQGNCIVWDLSSDDYHFSHKLDRTLRYADTEAPVTVFLVGKRNERFVGHYSVSGAPAYSISKDIYVVQLLDRNDPGKVVAKHVVGDNPRKQRIVQRSPEYANVGFETRSWIDSLCGSKLSK